MKIEHLCRPEVHACNVGDSLQQVAQQMNCHGVGVLAVRDHGRLVSIISERDVVGAVAAGGDTSTATAGGYTSWDIQVCTAGDDSTPVAHRMLEAGIRHMPVVSDGQVAGIVSTRDLLAIEVWA